MLNISWFWVSPLDAAAFIAKYITSYHTFAQLEWSQAFCVRCGSFHIIWQHYSPYVPPHTIRIIVRVIPGLLTLESYIAPLWVTNPGNQFEKIINVVNHTHCLIYIYIYSSSPSWLWIIRSSLWIVYKYIDLYQRLINTLRERQDDRHFPDDISIEISLKFVPKGSINNIPALFQPARRQAIIWTNDE